MVRDVGIAWYCTNVNGETACQWPKLHGMELGSRWSSVLQKECLKYPLRRELPHTKDAKSLLF